MSLGWKSATRTNLRQQLPKRAPETRWNRNRQLLISAPPLLDSTSSTPARTRSRALLVLPSLLILMGVLMSIPVLLRRLAISHNSERSAWGHQYPVPLRRIFLRNCQSNCQSKSLTPLFPHLLTTRGINLVH